MSQTREERTFTEQHDVIKQILHRHGTLKACMAYEFLLPPGMLPLQVLIQRAM